MSRATKLILLYIILIIVGLFVLSYVTMIIIEVVETLQEKKQKEIEELKKKGLYVPPPPKKVKQYYDEPPRQKDYDQSDLVDIRETELYKEVYKDGAPDKFEPRSDWIWFLFVLIFAMIYMYFSC
jgi:hypothetical protein